jgi:phosphoglycerol transferase MdoB-like AlkP superfamily enzyme
VTEPAAGEGESLWSRLRRRKLVQWGIAYVAGAWGLQQGIAYVSTLLHWREHLQQLAGLALLIGLPIVVVVAWYHGDKGRRRVTRTELTILTLLFVLGDALFWRYNRTRDGTLHPVLISMQAYSAERIRPSPIEGTGLFLQLKFARST